MQSPAPKRGRTMLCNVTCLCRNGLAVGAGVNSCKVDCIRPSFTSSLADCAAVLTGTCLSNGMPGDAMRAANCILYE